jgi:insulysin
VETHGMRLWHKLDDRFLVPKMNVFFEIRSPFAYSTVENCVLTQIYTELVKELINEFSYFAEVAGLTFQIENSVDGIVLNVCGFNDKIHVLLSEIFEKMRDLKVENTTFQRIKSAVMII